MTTHVDDALVVADEQVAEDAGLVEVAQPDHVLHPVDGGRVHGLDVGGILRINPVFLCDSRINVVRNIQVVLVLYADVTRTYKFFFNLVYSC